MNSADRAILGVGASANAGEIRSAYRRAAKLAHPDMGGSSEAFQRVRLAADRLLADLASDASTEPGRPARDNLHTSLEGHWISVSDDLISIWRLRREPVVVFAPQRIGLSPFTSGLCLNPAAFDWLTRKIGPRGEAWDFHVAGSVTRLFFRNADDARLFQLRFL